MCNFDPFHDFKRFRFLSLLFLCLFWIGLLPAPSATADVQYQDLCATAKPVDLGGSLRGYGILPGGKDHYEVQAPAAGWLTLDVAAPAGSVVEPKIAFLGSICSGGARQSYSLVEQRAASLVLFIEKPGSYTFTVTAQDPLLSLPAYKVRTAFLERPEAGPAPVKVAQTEPEPDPDPDSAGVEIGDELLAAVCQQARLDDHGDSFRCATPLPLGAAASGRLENGRGDDDDVFSLTLDRQRTVWLESRGDVGTVGEIYDRSGHRLAVAWALEDSGFHLVKTLAAGRYFVRVSGKDLAEGDYSLLSRWLDD